MKILCKIFGHKMYSESADIAGASTCKRCEHKKPAIKWDRRPMPKVKPPKIEDNLKRYICQLECAHATLRCAIRQDPANKVLCECDGNIRCLRCDAQEKILAMTEIDLL